MMQYEHKEVDFWRYCEKRKHYGVEDIKDSCAEKKYKLMIILILERLIIYLCSVYLMLVQTVETL